MKWAQSLPIVCFLCGTLVSSTRYDSYSDHCQSQKAQTALDLDELMGIWYGIKVFYHRDRAHNVEPRHQEVECPLILLSRDSKNEISLNWIEPSRVQVYYFKIIKPGVWRSLHSDNPPFKGNVRVLMAVSTHMVLTFCSHNTHFSVLMSRMKHLHYSEIEGFESMIETFNLTIYDKSRQCRSSAAIFSNSFYTVFVFILVCLYRLGCRFFTKRK